jgi:hypothetical protein
MGFGGAGKRKLRDRAECFSGWVWSNISAQAQLENSISEQGISPAFEEQNAHCGIHDKRKVSHTILDKTATPKLEAHPYWRTANSSFSTFPVNVHI